MAVFLVLLFPVLLMAFMLIMERIEKPLTRVAEERQVEEFLDRASTDELDTLVREGTEPAIHRFQSRRTAHRLRRGNHSR